MQILLVIVKLLRRLKNWGMKSKINLEQLLLHCIVSIIIVVDDINNIDASGFDGDMK